MLKSIEEVSSAIAAGKTLLLAGEECLLKRLPPGNWIGGTIPYFMSDQGGTVQREQIFVNDLSGVTDKARIATYATQNLPSIPTDAEKNGFSVIIIPALSSVHLEYAKNAPDYADLFLNPLVGWVAGVHLSELGKTSPKVFDGRSGKALDNEAAVMHCSVPHGKTPTIGIVNLFKQGQGQSIRFPEVGFQVKEAEIDGKMWNFAHYLKEMRIDTRLPLVADYCGAAVNVSFQQVNPEKGTVDLYAPVFPGRDYRVAEPVEDYVSAFLKAVPSNINPVFSCNCILNFLYSELENKKTPGVTGPITFGEIAYQLVNQTLVYLDIR